MAVAWGGVGASFTLTGGRLVVGISLWKLFADILPARTPSGAGIHVYSHMAAMLFTGLALFSLATWHPAHLVC